MHEHQWEMESGSIHAHIETSFVKMTAPRRHGIETYLFVFVSVLETEPKACVADKGSTTESQTVFLMMVEVS